MESLIVESVKKITILRANALGDFIVTLPAIKAIKAAYAKAEIVLLGKPWHKEFLKYNRTPVDRVIVMPLSKGICEEENRVEDEQELKSFFADMKKEEFDIAVSFQGKGMAANPFIKKLGAKLTVGLTCPQAEKLDRSVDCYYYQNEVIRYLEVAELIGAKPEGLEPEIRVLKTDMEESYHFIKKYQEKPEKSYIILNPSGMDKRRIWPWEKFAQVGDILSQKGYQVIFTGNTSEQVLSNSIIAKMNFPALNACGYLSLGGLAGLLAKSSLVISGDTGPLHLARAVGAKTVGIYWAPNLINWGPLFRANHRPVISWSLPCPLCGIIPNNPYPFEPKLSKCDHPVSFVKEVSVEEVMEQADALLNTGEKNDLKVFTEKVQKQ